MPAAEQNRPERKPYLCRHVFTDGRRCGSPAIRHQNFCYYHYAHRTPNVARGRRRSRDGFDLTRLDGLDNPTAIQLALPEVLGRVASNAIDPKNAWLLFYGLQIAGTNLRRSQSAENPLAPGIVEDEVLGQLTEPEPGRILPPDQVTRIKALILKYGPEEFDRHMDEIDDHI